MIRNVLMRVFVILMAPVLALGMTSQSASAEPADPDNAYEIYEGSYMYPDVLGNDGFTEADNAWVCRAEQPDPGLAFVDVYNGQLSVYINYDLPSGTVFSFQYYGCNEDMSKIVPAVVTITVLDVLRPVVKKTSRPERVKFMNPNLGDSIDCLYGSFNEPEPDGQVVVEASSAKTISTERRRLDWVCFLGQNFVFAGDGSVRRIEQNDLVSNYRHQTVRTQLTELWREHMTNG